VSLRPSAAALALARGDSLGALGIVGRLEDAEGLLLRGIAYAQMGDLNLARRALENAKKKSDDSLILARIAAACAEVDLAAGKAGPALRAARLAEESLLALGDRHNAAMQRLVASRALVLLGELEEAWRAIRDVPPELADVAALVRAEVATRRIEVSKALHALEEAGRSHHALLARAANAMRRELREPVARIREGPIVREVDLAAVEAASRGDAFLLDTCRRLVRAGRATIPLARRPALFEALLALAEPWPDGVERDALARRLFGTRHPNDSHRVRLRVEIGRLRKVLQGIATLEATRAGYALGSERPVLVLLPLTDDDGARIGSLLGDGAAWSAQELAEHAGISKRTALRVLRSLVSSGRVCSMGSGKEVRYASASPRIASRMLLLGLVPAS
jgi:tetratricopeptide (TPR) repeat protein